QTRHPASTLVPYRRSSDLDLPRELAKGARTDQAAAALERVEHAADRAQLLQVVGCRLPFGQHRIQVADFLLELLEEDLADLVVRSEEHTSELQSRENLVCR